MIENKEKLGDFIAKLKNKIGFSFNIDDFGDRLKLQKYVFLAKHFGFNHNYHYNLYIRGPYSSDLADDYYNVSNEGIFQNDSLNIENGFFDLIEGKTIEWLESATTMLSLFEDYTNKYSRLDNEHKRITLVVDTRKIKSHIEIKTIKNVYDDLIDYNLMN